MSFSSDFQPITISEEKTWTIVQFQDNSVEAVPTTWIQGDNCYWPTFSQNKIISAIKKCVPLNTCWPMHKVKIFGNATFGDYIKAREKSKAAEETSDLASDADGGIKRKRIQKILTSSSSDESFTMEQSILPPPPKIPNFRKAKTSVKPSYKTLEVHKDAVLNNKENMGFLENIRSNDFFNEEIVENTANSSSSYSAPHAACNGLCICCTSQNKNIERLMTQCHVLGGMVSDILLEVKEIRAHCGSLNNSNIEERGSIFTRFPELKFPLSSEEDINKFNNDLQNEKIFNQAVTDLAKIGGSNVYNFVKRVLTLLISNDEAKKYSWLGRKGKLQFHKLKMSKVIISAANKTSLSKSEKDTEAAIQSWLKRAAERSNQQTKKF